MRAYTLREVGQDLEGVVLCAVEVKQSQIKFIKQPDEETSNKERGDETQRKRVWGIYLKFLSRVAT